MAKKTQASAPIRLLDLVWSSTNEAVAHSWERLNHAMYGALRLAIGAGFEFAEGDIRYVMEHYRSSYWIGDPESIYAYAVRSDNMSAIKSFEAWRGRKPFIAEKVNLHGYGHDNPYQHSQAGDRQKSRLAVGFSFRWNGQEVKVTSFAGDQLSFTACSYKKSGEDGEKLHNRYSITHEELLQGRVYDRERKTLLERTRKATDEARAKIVKALKLKKDSDWADRPIEKLREVVDRHAPENPRLPVIHCQSVIITQEHANRFRQMPLSGQPYGMSRRFNVGMKSTRLPSDDRMWLVDNASELAIAIGFGALVARDQLLEKARSMRGEAAE